MTKKVWVLKASDWCLSSIHSTKEKAEAAKKAAEAISNVSYSVESWSVK